MGYLQWCDICLYKNALQSVCNRDLAYQTFNTLKKLYSMYTDVIMYVTVQLEGNLIHAGSCVSRIALVVMQAPTISDAGTCMHREANN